MFSDPSGSPVVKLHQKRTSYVIHLGKTMFAFDKDRTKEIFVKKSR
jgi:hypothetical protein